MSYIAHKDGERIQTLQEHLLGTAELAKQSPNFIFDVTDCPLFEEEMERQIKSLYSSQHTRFIEKIVVMKNGEVVKAYKRK